MTISESEMAAAREQALGARGERRLLNALAGLIMRAGLAPALWLWGRSGADGWTGVDPGMVAAAEVWALPVLDPAAVAGAAVWGAHLCAALLAAGFFTRLAAVAVLLGCGAFAAWVAPEGWSSALLVAAPAAYLALRGPGAISLDYAAGLTAR
ncbi:MAG: hypothetical protein KIS81_05175 [Maricaulaceae bacterium]|nr:hypothetical protein [Maricaulaceae bacterium]